MKESITLFIGFLLISLNGKSQTLDTLLQIGTHEMHFSINEGNGIPILFESGGGDTGLVWESLADSINTKIGATTIFYDRAGYGNSSINPLLEEKKQGFVLNATINLEKCLEQLGHSEGIIIVAHSYGSFISQLFAARNPSLVKGIILIDANDVCFFSEDVLNGFQEMFTEDFFRELEGANPGLYYEALAFHNSVDYMKNISVPENIPILALRAENPPNIFNNEDHVELRKSCHDRFVQKNDNRIGIIAENSGHYIYRDSPNLVANSIIAFCQKIHSTKGLSKENPVYNGDINEIEVIKNIIKNFSKFYVAGDTKSLIECYTTDGKILPDGYGILKGEKELFDYWKRPEHVQILEHKAHPHEITIIDDMAYDYGTYEGISMVNNENVYYWKGKYLIVWKKIDGNWKIYLDIWNRIN